MLSPSKYMSDRLGELFELFHYVLDLGDSGMFYNWLQKLFNESNYTWVNFKYLYFFSSCLFNGLSEKSERYVVLCKKLDMEHSGFCIIPLD